MTTIGSVRRAMENVEKCTSRNIPLAIQREVRQRCGFGCVICGIPLYEYEHMAEWATVRRHVADEITLLCDQHHREKTAGLLPKEVVAKANQSPYNFQKNVPKPYNLYFSGTEAQVVLGGNSFTCEKSDYGTTMAPVVVDNTPLVSFTFLDDHLLLNLIVFDEYNYVVLQIKDNQLFYSTLPWDIQLIGTTLTIREAHRKILLEIEFAPPNKITINRGRFLCNGVEILVRPTNLLITNNSITVSGSQAYNCNGGLIIGPNNNLSSIMTITHIPRYAFDRTEALAFEKECREEDE